MPRTDCLSLILEDDIAAQQHLGWRLEPGVPDPGHPLLAPAYPLGQRRHDPVDGLWKGWYISTPMGAAAPARPGTRASWSAWHPAGATNPP